MNTYRKILRPKRTELMKEAVIEWFEDKENYIYMHKIGCNLDDIGEIEE